MSARPPLEAKPSSSVTTLTPWKMGLAQRACACAVHSGGGECGACQERHVGARAVGIGSLQRRAADHTRSLEGPAVVQEVLRSGGQPLEPETRAFFEPRFGHDFSQVRVHTGTMAAESASAVNALAYTVGNDVVFGAGEYSPQSHAGRRLLAHELSHVLQQRAGLATIAVENGVDAAYEREAERISERVADHADELLSDTQLNYRITSARADASASLPSALLQRRVRDTKVSCRTTGLHGGVPGGRISGPDAINVITGADIRARTLAQAATNRIANQRATAGTPAYVADPQLDGALANRFGLHLANPAERLRIATLEREFRAVAGLLNRELHYVCRDPGCGADDWAMGVPGQHTIRLCNPFWNGGGTPNFQASSVLHEAVHLWWDQVDDHGRPPLHNAHCFEQFALDLAGATAEIPAGFAGACVVPP